MEEARGGAAWMEESTMNIAANLTKGHESIGFEDTLRKKIVTEPFTTNAPALTSARPARRDRA